MPIWGPDELLAVDGNIDDWHGNEKPGLEWIQMVRRHFPHMVWLNPLHEKLWHYDYSMPDRGHYCRKCPSFLLHFKRLEKAIDHLQEMKKTVQTRDVPLLHSLFGFVS